MTEDTKRQRSTLCPLWLFRKSKTRLEIDQGVFYFAAYCMGLLVRQDGQIDGELRRTTMRGRAWGRGRPTLANGHRRRRGQAADRVRGRHNRDIGAGAGVAVGHDRAAAQTNVFHRAAITVVPGIGHIGAGAQGRGEGHRLVGELRAIIHRSQTDHRRIHLDACLLANVGAAQRGIGDDDPELWIGRNRSRGDRRKECDCEGAVIIQGDRRAAHLLPGIRDRVAIGIEDAARCWEHGGNLAHTDIEHRVKICDGFAIDLIRAKVKAGAMRTWVIFKVVGKTGIDTLVHHVGGIDRSR